ncbi:hypothetical protein LV716_17735 [Flagellimonas sp. HMM57]|uniref:hypothetical protein n=1 Tax=unclassified Flagellimonas TaxID=2644544 RepID=UPI0013D168B8|nr:MULTISPECIES: hypothetical protein [unclassified Flagellimonas]UII76084.1 hypothetical protein LV716_17735 [Flagellimonas sp. HMM57]
MGEIRPSDYRIRKLVGILGLSLPLALPLLADLDVISSISHYYYLTAPSLYFIIVLSALALVLISYKGYEKDSDELITDDWITNLAGFAALIVVLVPTSCSESGNATIQVICRKGILPLFGHDDNFTDDIHLVSAAVFVFLMGWMSFVKFSRNQQGKWQYMWYRACGIITWCAIAILVLYFLLDLKLDNFVFWLEVVALVPFGISWLIKGEAVEMVKNMF